MFCVYVLRGTTTGHLYTGFTSDLEWRLGQHNRGITKSTKNRCPWELAHREPLPRVSESPLEVSGGLDI